MKIVYLDCFSGISGDMTLAALVDAGADKDYVESELSKIRLEPFTLEWKRVNKRGISSLKMDVVQDPNAMPQYHRHYSEIEEMIKNAGFNERVVSLSLAIFRKIAIAEAKIHGISLEKVHFHEVGAIDSIVDVIGVALALDSLQVEQIYSSPVPLGSGKVRCGHGLYPVPAPATLEMMKGLPIAPCPYSMEMTTPTGAGIVSGVVSQFSAGLPAMIVEAIGYGAGTRDLPDQPNVLRAVVGRVDAQKSPAQAHVHAPVLEFSPLHEHRHEHENEHEHVHKHGHEHTRGDDDHSHEHGHVHTHGHDHSHEHGHEHGHGHDHSHEHGHEHSHGHDHSHEHGHVHTHGHEHSHEYEHSLDSHKGQDPGHSHGLDEETPHLHEEEHKH